MESTEKAEYFCRSSRAVIGREPMGVTAKLYALGSQLSGDMQNF